MGSTLTNGIYLPAEGERNCYTGLAANWSALDSLIGGYNAHIGNTTIHVTAEDKQAWNGKADSSALTAHTGDATIHVTAEDKAKWNTVTSKADDSDVVHKSGNETISGNKTFSSINGVEPSSLSLPSDRSARIDISSYFTDTSTGGVNRYTAPANGFIYLLVTDVVTMHVLSQTSNNLTNYGDTKGRNTAGQLNAFLPVRKNDVFACQWYTTATNVTLTSAYFIPCRGNV